MVYSWCEGKPQGDASINKPLEQELYARLSSQLLLDLGQCVRPVGSGDELSKLGFEEDLHQKTITTCHKWLDCLFRHFEEEIAVPTVLDPFLITTAGVVCDRLQRELPISENPALRQCCSEIHTYAVSLLTSLTNKFNIVKDLRKLLMLQHRLRATVAGSAYGRASDNSAELRGVATQLSEWEHMMEIPRPLRRMMLESLHSYTSPLTI